MFKNIITYIVLFFASIVSIFSGTFVGQGSAAESIAFDFESGEEGWERSMADREQSIYAILLNSNEQYSGRYSLELKTRLDYSDINLQQGLAFVMSPGNMQGHRISAYVKCSSGAEGDPQHRNGVRLFVWDRDFKAQFGAWRNFGQEPPHGMPENEWAEIELTPSRSGPPDGYTELGFDPTKIMSVGIQLAVGTHSEKEFHGSCFLDAVRLSRATLQVPESDHLFDFQTLTEQQQRDKPFGYGPYWDPDPAWSADAWDSDHVMAAHEALVIEAEFVVTENSDNTRKGFIGVELQPNLDISNKTNRIIRAEVKFDPAIATAKMLASIWLFDRRDAGQNCTAEDCKWYRSRDIFVGGDRWNELVFDLDEVSDYHRDSDLSAGDLTEDSLRTNLKLGIQFYANEPYEGKVYLDNVTVGGAEQSFEPCNYNFVTRNGAGFELNGEPFRFSGTNNYYLSYKSHPMIDDVMQTMIRNGLRVVRTWGFGDGTALFAEDDDGLANGNEGGAFQPEPGLYYEPTFQNFDYVVKSAGEHCVRLIIPLVNHWSDRDKEGGQNNFGGMGQYIEWCGIAVDDTGRIANKDLFYTDSCARQRYKDYVAHFVNRVNPLTGLQYKYDPTILAWELANEPRCEERDGCPSTEAVYNWTVEMSAFIREQLEDSQQLIALGDEGLLNEPGSADPYYNGFFGVDWERNLSIETIDFGTVHLYPDAWEKDPDWSRSWIIDHIQFAERAGKPLIFEEFGICEEKGGGICPEGFVEGQFDRDSVYSEWTDLFAMEGGEGVDGDLVWMIAGKVNGCNENHKMLDGECYFPDFDGFTFWAPVTSTMCIIRDHAALMRRESGLRGDLNNDGVVDFLDISLYVAVAKGGIELTHSEEAFHDLDQDGLITIFDANLAAKLVHRPSRKSIIDECALGNARYLRE